MEQLLEWMKMVLRANHVDITSINPATIKQMPNNPELCYKIELFAQPMRSGDPELKVKFYAYPDKQKLFMEPHEQTTAIETHFRSQGFMGQDMLHWDVEVI